MERQMLERLDYEVDLTKPIPKGLLVRAIQEALKDHPMLNRAGESIR